MLVVKTYVKPSPIEGLGLFAGERIPKGTTIWKYNPAFDLEFTQEQILAMPALQQEFMRKYAYLDKETGKYIYCADNGRFVNHSGNPNMGDADDGSDYALRDIEEGEELTSDYRDFDKNAAEKGEILQVTDL